MSLSGQLSDLSLAELIEFFGNLRKTGRLKVEYQEGTGIFYFKDGDLVDAQLGGRVGAEAVYHALTLPNAAFDFNTHIFASRRTINESWMQLVLEGLRRIDEGVTPDQNLSPEDQPRVSGAEAGKRENDPSVAGVVAFMDGLYRADDGPAQKKAAPSADRGKHYQPSRSGGHARRPALIGAALILLICCGIAAVALTSWFGKSSPTAANAPTATVAPLDSANAATTAPATENVNGEIAPPASSDPTPNAQAARIAEQQRAARAAAAAAARNANAAARENNPAAAAGPKTVMVEVTVDESGRVAQASVANSRPGMQSYESSALRIARQRRYPAGKSGVVRVPVTINQ